MNGHAQAGHGVHERLLQFVAQVGGTLQGPVAGHVHVQVGKAALAGAARHHVVEAQPVALGMVGGEGVERGAHGGERLGIERLVHQALRRAPHELEALAHDVERHADGDQRVEPEPAAEMHGHDADQHADRGPDVGHQVTPVGLQRDGAVRARRAEQHERQRRVEARADHRQRQAPAQLLQRLRRQQPQHRHPQDGDGGGHDQQALEAGREVLGLVVAVGMVLVGRALGDGHHRQREHGAGEVDAGLHGVRNQAHRVRQVAGPSLQEDGDQGHRDRDAKQRFRGQRHAERTRSGKKGLCGRALRRRNRLNYQPRDHM
ncbi:hypothetical protein D9M68_660100 [compost metagenome]